MIALPELLVGGLLGYILCAYLIGRYIGNAVQDAIDDHIAAATYLFINEKTKETTSVQIEINEDA